MPTVRYTSMNGEVLAEKRGGVRKLYVPDPLGSTAALLNTSQAKTDSFTYWPYGEERSVTGTAPTPFRFVGTQGYFRDTSNRSYVRTRHYQPGYGRWLTVDPLTYGLVWFQYSNELIAKVTYGKGLGRSKWLNTSRHALGERVPGANQGRGGFRKRATAFVA